ncbi:E3 SUMO-protein ligase ZBED1-like [Arctopsyche grandis]|uniref:E3 SUMO-protein ligase ZBED1-like n=1 Tax=Arctopsyche grandis TaxID=121162 RepID=UPI00406D8ED7
MNLPVLKLKQDVQTRWNSTFDMLKRIVQVKDAVIATVALLRPDLTLNEGDWEVIEEVLPLLSPFYEITVEISAEKNVTLSKIIILCNLLKFFLQKHVSYNTKIVDVQSLLKKGMEDRFKDIEKNMLYAECTILDPRFKTRGFKNQRACEMVVQALRNKIGQVQLVQGDTPEAVPTSSDASTSIPSNKNSCIWDEYDQEIQKITRPDNQLAAGIRELDKYLNEEYLNRKEDPLQWWHERRLIYPHVYAYVLKRFCVVATSVPCERVFSATGQVLNERRTLLSSNKVSKLIFLHSNM